MIHPNDIHPITEFRRSASLAAAIAADGRPHVLTEEGRPKFVIQGAASYQELITALHHAETVGRIHAGLASMRQGGGVPAREALDELAASRT